MNARTLPARAWIVLAAALAVAAAGCGEGDLDKAGGAVTRPVILTLANDSSDPSGAQPFASAVREISHGALQIKIEGPSARLHDLTSDETPLITDVKAGKAQLALTGTQAFDTSGAAALEALQAPFLIDSYALQRKVMESDIPRQMLAALKPTGVIGLGLLPGPLARPYGFKRPLLAASDYQGAKIGILPSLVEGDAIQALGAVPRPPEAGLAHLNGVEVDVQAADTGGNVPNATLTGNVVLWPWPGVIFMNPRAFESLTAAQRSELLRAGAEAQVHAHPYYGADAAYARDLCRRNKIMTASAADLAGLRAAVEPVYAGLEASPATKAFIAQIASLRQAIGGSTDSVTCASSRTTAQSTTAASLVEGTWQVTYTRQEFVAAVADPEEIWQSGEWGHFVLRISGGHWWFRLTSGHAAAGLNDTSADGTYVVTGNKILFRRHDRAYLGSDTEVWGPYIWSVFRDTLTFKKTGVAPTELVVKPWLKMVT